MDKRYSIYQAKAKFSELVRKVLSQGQVVITQRGVPVVRLIPYTPDVMDVKQKLSSLSSIGKARLAKKSWPKKLHKSETLTVPQGAVERFLDGR